MQGIRKNQTKIMILCLFILFISCGNVFASGGEQGHDSKAKGWADTDTYRVVNFSILAIGLFLVLKKPVKTMLSSRITDIESQLKELEMRKSEAEKSLADYDARILALNKEAEQIISEYIKQGNEAKDRILKVAESTSKKIEEQAKKNIVQEFDKAKQELQVTIFEKAVTEAEKLIKSKISDKDQKKMIDDYLEKVVV